MKKEAEMIKIGDRVGCILSATIDEVRFLGWGTYQGDKVPPSGLGWMTDILAEMQHKNPCILLDNGDTVWGAECWWFGELRTHEAIGGRKVVDVRIGDARVAAKGAKP